MTRIRPAICCSNSGFNGDEDPQRLSGGEARRAALARVLAPQPDILLLDEPTNHLDMPTIEWLEATLAAQRGALVLISHDRRFLETLSRSTVWLDRGQARRVEVGFKEFEAWRDEKLAEEEVQQHKLDRKIVREEHWVRYGVTARRKRNVRRMAELRALRQTRREHRRATGKAVIEAAAGGKVRYARYRGEGHLQVVSASAGSSIISRAASCAATASASSARTAAARLR